MTGWNRLFNRSAMTALHEEKLLSRSELVDILQDLVNAAALDNGYAEKYGLPCPARRQRPNRRSRRVP